MATFITTMHFTEQGTKGVRDTCERAAAFKAAAKKMGVKVSGHYWTLGAFDGVIVFEAPDEATATAAMIRNGSTSSTSCDLDRLTGSRPAVNRRPSRRTGPAAPVRLCPRVLFKGPAIAAGTGRILPAVTVGAVWVTP